MDAIAKTSFAPRRRLRSRVTLFFLLAAMPATLTSVGAVVVLDRLIQQEIDERTRDGVRAVRAMLEELSSRAVEEVEQVAESEPLRELASAIDGNLERYEGEAATRAALVGLEVLAFVGARGPSKGLVISSAHLSSAVGDDAAAFVTTAHERAPVGLVHVLVGGNPPKIVPAIVATRLVRDTQREPAVVVYGGLRLDGRRLEDLARLIGASLVLRSPGLPEVVYGPKIPPGIGRAQVVPAIRDGRRLTPQGLVGDPTDDSVLEVRVHTPRLERARSLFLVLSVALIVLSLLAALAASAYLSNKIAGPIVDLSAAALDVGAGNLDVQIEPRSEDEVGSLVRVFNHMTHELSESQLRLARAERVAAWQQIARRVAHEIKNPLFPIQMSMETIRKGYRNKHPKLDEIIEESTKTVLEEVRSLNRIVTEFSDFARLPAPELQATPVTTLLEHVYGLYQGTESVRYDKRAVEARGLGDLPVDREQIGRALKNLVKNALEAVPESGGTVTLDARAEDRSGRPGVLIAVADNGHGMSEEVRKKIFTPYFTTKDAGTGLGLAIVERIVQEHGGEIDVRSGADVGTTFLLWLPKGPKSAPTASSSVPR